MSPNPSVPSAFRKSRVRPTRKGGVASTLHEPQITATPKGSEARSELLQRLCRTELLQVAGDKFALDVVPAKLFQQGASSTRISRYHCQLPTALAGQTRDGFGRLLEQSAVPGLDVALVAFLL